MVLLNANVQSYLGEIKTNHRDSFDFLERMIDIPQVDLLACAWLVNSKFASTILVDVDTPVTSRSLLRWTMFAADTAHSAKARAAAGSDREAQLLMGETAENLDKVDVSLRTGSHFLTYPTFLTLLANIAGIVGSFYVCDKQSIDAPTNPLIYRFARQVAFELSSDDSRTWLKHNPGQARPLFAWWVSILYDPGQIDTFKFGGQLVHMHLSGIDVTPKEYATKELSYPQLVKKIGWPTPTA